MAYIVFVSPPDKFLENAGDRAPLGIGYLSSYCKSLGHRTKIFDLNHEKEGDMFREIKDHPPDFVCFTVATPTYNDCINMAKRISVNFNGKLVAGGNHVTNIPHEPLTIQTFDYVVVGDGENAIREIINGEAKQQVIISKPIEDLDSLPMPDYEGLKFERYGMKLDGEKGAVLVTSRGCVFNCFFCGSAKLKKWRSHSPQRVIEEMKILYGKYGIRGFYFGDDIFTFNKQRVYDICKLMNDTFNKKDISWRATTRVDLVDEPLLEAMHNAGCNILSFGFESGNNDVLRALHKGSAATTERAEEVVRMCKNIGIKVKGFFIIGLPEETWDRVMQSIEFAKRLDLEYVDFYPLTPFPNTPFWDSPESFGIEIEYPKESRWETYYQVGKGGAGKLHIKHPNLTKQQILQLVDIARKELRKDGKTYNK